MIRVLHLINWLNVGGLEKRLLALLAEIPRDRVEMDILCKGKNTGILAPHAEQLGARIYHCPLTLLHIGFAKGLARIIKEGNYDILHNHLGAASGLAVWVAQRCGVKVITTFVCTNPVFTRWSSQPVLRQLNAAYTFLSTRYAVRHSDLVTGVSTAVLDAVAPDHRSRSNCLVVHSGVALNTTSTQLEREALRNELGLPPNCPLILHVGRFTWEKNHQGVLAIFQEVLRSVPDARLLLVGTGPLVGDIESEVIKLGLQDRVHMLGLRHDVPRLMRCSQVFVLPSFYEGLPVTVLEALASSLPIVASAIPGIADEVVQHERTGFLHPTDQSHAMARSVVQLLADLDLAGRIARAGRALIETHFSLAATAERHIQLYERCLQIKPNRPPQGREVSQGVSSV